LRYELKEIPHHERAKEPKTPFDRAIRELAEAAMKVCRHDCGPEFDIEWHHEIKAMEEKFRRIVRLRARHLNPAKSYPAQKRRFRTAGDWNERGNRRGRHHQLLTDDVGHPALAQHIYALLGEEYNDASADAGYYLVPQRALAAFLAIADRFRGDSAAARAAPPLAPPSFPSATAAGFFPAFLSGNGDPSHFSPMACSTTRRATLAKS
jgi:hypothetical protein